jgi:hypothetical protein
VCPVWGQQTALNTHQPLGVFFLFNGKKFCIVSGIIDIATL